MTLRRDSHVKIALAVIGSLIASTSGEASAFEDDGLKSGMGIYDALDTFKAAFGQANEITPPGSEVRAFINFTGSARAMQFCHDRLTAYEKEVPGSDRQALINAVKGESEKHGVPERTLKKDPAGNPPAAYEIFSWNSLPGETEQLVMTAIGNQEPYIRLFRFVENDCGISGY
jgi:hypothetical protein